MKSHPVGSTTADRSRLIRQESLELTVTHARTGHYLLIARDLAVRPIGSGYLTATYPTRAAAARAAARLIRRGWAR